MPHRFRKYSKSILSKEKKYFATKNTANISAVLVYPNSYKIGINNLGFQSVYCLLNQTDHIFAERSFYYPAPFDKTALSLESNRHLSDFDLIAFSLAFELDYINMVKILINAKIPIRAKDRDDSYPLIAAGGMVMFMNPMPIAPFLDIIFIGEAEGMLEPFVKIIEKARVDQWNKKKILNELAKLKGIFIPAVHNSNTANIIERQYRPKTWINSNQSALTTPEGIFKNMYLIEVGRGCPRRCRFCASGYVYQPYRVNRLQDIKENVNTKEFDNRSVGLVGSAISDYPDLPDLMDHVIKHNGRLGVSSFRVEELTPRNIELFERGGLKTVTVAPEAGSERMRSIIQKNIPENDILNGARRVARSKISTLKLYFMMGLPFEIDNDIDAIVELGRKINEIYNEQNSMGMVKISCNAFIPKAFTPFQWSSMCHEKEINSKRNYLKNQFRKFNRIEFKSTKSAREDVLQGILSLGNEKVSNLIEGLAFNHRNWKMICREIDFDYEGLLYPEKSYQQILPWDFIKGTVSKQYLWKEYMRAKELGVDD